MAALNGGPARAVKRAIDVVAAILVGVITFPITAAAALAVRLSGPGPVLFRQVREGLGGAQFRIYKFRTMTQDAERTGPVLSMSDARVTTVGAVLRRTSLDEMPQLLNVLKGEMSLVGPRPLLPGTVRPDEARRRDVRPGMTSLVEVSRPHELTWDERMRLDVEYVERWSLGLDLRILVGTIPALFTRKDILDLPRQADESEREVAR